MAKLKIRFHFSFWIFAILLIYFQKFELLLCMVSAVIIHELGHYIVAEKLGYDLSPEDLQKVYREFLRVAAKKQVGAKEIDSIIASVAMQVPETYMLDNYVINTGNIVNASAQITLKKGEKLLKGIAIGDGPIDAAFLTIEQIIGRHFELDDFQIQSVTRGHEAVGNTIVKLRNNGKLYSGNGVSTDILGASIRAYLNAVNKIIYEESE